jgi:hypothetical protein
MKKVFLFAVCCIIIIACTNEKSSEKKMEESSEMNPPPAEFADPKYAEIGRSALDAFSRGDIDGWMAGYADNAVYSWNNGDSLAGKPAIDGYWRKRRLETLDTISFSNAIFLPVKVNQPQSVEASGVWLLVWHQIDAVYFTGKRVVQWIHTDYHFNENDKIDRVIQYVDRAPINAALAD